MTCPNCGKDMNDWTLDGRLGLQVIVRVCAGCQSFWFDEHKSLQITPGSTLKLMKFIGEHSSTVPVAGALWRWRTISSATCASTIGNVEAATDALSAFSTS